MQPKEKEHLAGLEQRRWSDRKEGMESAWESTARHQARNGREASLGKRGVELQRGFREGLAFIGHSWKWKRCGNKDLPTSEVESERFSAQVATKAGAGLVQSWELGASSRSPTWILSHRGLSHPLLLSQAINSKLDRKSGSQA